MHVTGSESVKKDILESGLICDTSSDFIEEFSWKS